MLFLSHKNCNIIHDYGNHMVTVVYEYFISFYMHMILANNSFKLNGPTHNTAVYSCSASPRKSTTLLKQHTYTTHIMTPNLLSYTQGHIR